jgi:cell division septation protein DedD
VPKAPESAATAVAANAPQKGTPAAAPHGSAKNATVAASKPVPVVAAEPSGVWFVQLGSFASKSNADRLIRALKAKGYPVKVTVIETSDKPLFRVRVGPQADKARADALNSRLKRDGHGGAVTSLP